MLWLVVLAEVSALKQSSDSARGLTPNCRPGDPCFEKSFISVHPTWYNAFSFDNKRKMVSGTLKIEMKWDTEFDFGGPSPDASFDPRNMIVAENFASSSGRTMLGKIPIVDENGNDESDSGLIFTGDFTQSLDLMCFPFDEQTVAWTISIMKPGDTIMELVLFCGEGETAELDELGHTSTCTKNIDGASMGFTWDAFACRKMDSGTVYCSMHGVRQSQSSVLGVVLPTFLFILMSYTSFSFQAATKAMPRVGTTVISLLTLTTMKNNISMTLPSIVGLAWLELYSVIGIILMWENLMATGVVFYLDLHSYSFRRDLVDRIHLFFGFPTFLLMAFGILLSRKCPGTSDWATAIVILASALIVLSGLFLGRQYKNHVLQLTLVQDVESFPLGKQEPAIDE